MLFGKMLWSLILLATMLWSLILYSILSAAKLERAFRTLGGLTTRARCVLPAAPECASVSPFLCCWLCSPGPWAHPHSTPCLPGGQEALRSSQSVRQGFTFRQMKCAYCYKHRGNERLSQKNQLFQHMPSKITSRL